MSCKYILCFVYLFSSSYVYVISFEIIPQFLDVLLFFFLFIFCSLFISVAKFLFYSGGMSSQLMSPSIAVYFYYSVSFLAFIFYSFSEFPSLCFLYISCLEWCLLFYYSPSYMNYRYLKCLSDNYNICVLSESGSDAFLSLQIIF